MAVELIPPLTCDTPAYPDASPTVSASAIRSTNPWPPLKITEALLKWLRHHFSDASRIELPNLRSRVYVDNENTPITIASLAEWRPTNSDQRPAILVNREAQQPVPGLRGIDNRLMGGCGLGNTVTAYTQYWSGTHVVYCYGGREGEGEELAVEVVRELAGFQSLARLILCLEKLQVSGVGKRVQLPEFKETWLIPVVLEYGYALKWRIGSLDTAAVTAIFGPLTQGT